MHYFKTYFIPSLSMPFGNMANIIYMPPTAYSHMPLALACTAHHPPMHPPLTPLSALQLCSFPRLTVAHVKSKYRFVPYSLCLPGDKFLTNGKHLWLWQVSNVKIRNTTCSLEKKASFQQLSACKASDMNTLVDSL